MGLKLSKTELAILRELVENDGLNISRLAEVIGSPVSYISRVVSSLDRKGLVEESREGSTKSVALSEADHAVKFRQMVRENEHVGWEEILSNKSLEVLSAVSCLRLKTRKEILGHANISGATLSNVMHAFKRIGLVYKDGYYVVNPRFGRVEEFVNAYAHYCNEHRARSIVKDYLIRWECGAEFIFETHRKLPELEPTGVSAYPRYGVQVFSDRWLYYHPSKERKIGLEDAMIHHLLADGTKSILLLLLTWKKNEELLNLQHLVGEAEEYGVLNYVEAIVRYFGSEGEERADYLPPWKEFVVKAGEYGI